MTFIRYPIDRMRGGEATASASVTHLTRKRFLAKYVNDKTQSPTHGWQNIICLHLVLSISYLRLVTSASGWSQLHPLTLSLRLRQHVRDDLTVRNCTLRPQKSALYIAIELHCLCYSDKFAIEPSEESTDSQWLVFLQPALNVDD
jgi:hypothetical protein